MQILSVVGSDQILLEKKFPEYKIVLDKLLLFSVIVSNSEHCMQFEFSPYLLWSSVSRGLFQENGLDWFEPFLKYPLAQTFLSDFNHAYDRFFSLKETQKKKHPILFRSIDNEGSLFSSIELKEYQKRAIDVFVKNKEFKSGVVVLPSGYGKTLTACGVIKLYAKDCLVLNINDNIRNQWKREFFEKGSFDKAVLIDGVDEKELDDGVEQPRVFFMTFKEFLERKTFTNYSLIVIDEVHKITESMMRMIPDETVVLGLTATPNVHGMNAELFYKKIGPIVFEETTEESQLMLNQSLYFEVMVDMPADEFRKSLIAQNKSEKFRLASINSSKVSVCSYFFREFVREKKRRFVVFGHFQEQIKALSLATELPMISGKTTFSKREQIYKSFREGKMQGFISSGVSNEAIDLPEANTIISMSGKKDNDVEEMQRFGRMLRKKKGSIVMISLVSKNTIEESSLINRKVVLEKNGIKTQRKTKEEVLEILKKLNY